ncbi:MAG TPA: VOC family protein [Baekduia sp.]|uniref:VOC family protein n=1 Tax=Baekduia sp. TaxID=2600305 RepID=UPI002D765CE7|nr:VOC family protein [Baekduia sp.]HET6509026.1 VOC family protein [Baekduia sp.]
MGSVGMCVTDIDASVAFAQDVLGLREVERVGSTVYLTCNERHHELVLIATDSAGLDHVALQVADGQALNDVRARVERLGGEILPNRADEAGVAETLRFASPEGHVYEVFHGIASEEPAKYAHIGVRPRKFAHVTLKTPDISKTEAFLEEALGFRVSDRMGDAMSWLRCNADHHGIGLVDGAASLHHYAFELEGWSSLGVLGDLLLSRDLQFIFGPGRHGPGNNLYTYFLDPAGAMVEYMADIQQVDDEAVHRPGAWPADPLTVNRWGVAPPEVFFQQEHPLVRAGIPA